MDLAQCALSIAGVLQRTFSITGQGGHGSGGYRRTTSSSCSTTRCC